MKLIRFEYQGEVSAGMVAGDSYLDLDSLWASNPGHAIHGLGPRGSMRRLLTFCTRPDSPLALVPALEALKSEPAGQDFLREPSHCTLLAPIHDPGKIICLGLNYADHAKEQGLEPPSMPVIFAKFASCIVGPGESVRLPLRYTQKSDYEVELVVVIGKAGKEIAETNAMQHVAAYTILNDVTARDFQAQDKQWVRGKSCDTFAPLGPHLVTADEITDPHRLRLDLRLNGQTMQTSSTSQLVFKIPYLIAYLSRCMTLQPGDLISTGTPPGVGVFRTPPVFLADGDVMEASIEGIGVLTNPVVG